MITQEVCGFILINKPKDISSFACVKYLKRFLPRKTKIGHAGTLDNFATGLLIIGIGRLATRELGNLINQDKQYSVRAKFGELTDTLDYTGIVLETKPCPDKITYESLAEAIAQLGTQYIQTPPIYSALKHNGAPLYSLARNHLVTHEELKNIVQEKTRMVMLYNITITELALPFFSFTAHVSKGTYIRTLVQDIAQKLNSVATTYELMRTDIDNLNLVDAHQLSAITSTDDIITRLIDIDTIKERIRKK